MIQPKNNSISIRSRLKSFVFAFNGILLSFKLGHNIWVQSVIGMLVVLAGFWLGISIAEWLFVVLAIGMVLSAEVFNTAIELLVDFVSPEHNKKAGEVKDLAAGAVLLASIAAAVIGLLIFIPRLINLV